MEKHVTPPPPLGFDENRINAEQEECDLFFL